MKQPPQNLALLIIDGFGIAPDGPGNAISIAKTPTWDYLQRTYPHIGIDASGNHVGLPDGYMGNSEVGHLTIGTGRITFQSFENINRSIRDGSLSSNSVITQIRDHLKSRGRLHLMGLVSDGGVHSHQDHLYELLRIFSKDSFDRFVHAFTDGRDTPPTSARQYIIDLLPKLEGARLASVIGRYYVMDRDKKWDRTEIAFDMLTQMETYPVVDSVDEIQRRYDMGETDEFLKPIVSDVDGSIRDNDAVLFFNFRPDRARQITMVLNSLHNLNKKVPKNLCYTTMTQYEESWMFPSLFPAAKITNSLAEMISKTGFTQSHVAETEKYAHVTFFLNGGVETPFENEDRILIPSLKVATYDLQPSMSTIAIAEAAVKEIDRRQNFVVINIAAPDMVGHTGKIDATVEALEVTDKAIKMIYDSCKRNDFILIITSDHGNCEKMLHGDAPHTAHTTNFVPFLITKNVSLNDTGGLSNIAPTILQLLNINKPDNMTSDSLIQ
ncbi:MAG: 2,3-bisphosphoglycerate-independent phosphoglycerate mutase [Candidatus Heimdallarchaeota archaeon]|nr:2,3-bisphosphoglycerate-independent phosphoglycerate mutase [Candidatus Heimdallarchaeota archaeon]